MIDECEGDAVNSWRLVVMNPNYWLSGNCCKTHIDMQIIA
ncbi:hypothetical protein SAMN05192566_1752 [Methylophilus rhizosphaerae]|uniref:Uncharacterized protein n=1 Tax=Methylophilus rhizosphaerae TaxID=492660 RepID=A0A1G9D2I7_9PROT|nr:hypothetical protein SAMN05192566_1752 [Methylophilus rhizosphaerae]